MQSKLVRLSYSGIVSMIVITSPASGVWRVQSKDPRLLSFVVKVVLAMESKCSQCLFQTVEIFGWVDVVVEHINNALGHAGDVKNSKPEFYDVAHFLSSCSGKGKDLISFFSPGTATCSKKSLYATLPQSLVTLKARIHFPGPLS